MVNPKLFEPSPFGLRRSELESALEHGEMHHTYLGQLTRVGYAEVRGGRAVVFLRTPKNDRPQHWWVVYDRGLSRAAYEFERVRQIERVVISYEPMGEWGQ